MRHNWSNLAILAALAPSKSVLSTASDSRLRERQDWVASTSSSSYNYWWPYPPWGATDTSTPTAHDTWTSSTPTTVWWTPPATTQALTSIPTAVASVTEGTDDSLPDPSPSQDPNISSNLPSSFPTPDIVSDSTAIPSSTEFPFATSSPSQSSSRNYKPVYLISIFAACVLAGGLGLAYYVAKRWEADQGRRWGDPRLMARLESGNTEDEKGITTFANVSQRQHTPPSTRPWWSAQGYLPRFNIQAKYFRLGGTKMDEVNSSTNRPPFSFPDLLSSPDPNRTCLDPSTYGYGQWRERSVGRYIRPETSDLSRAYSKEGDAEEVEIDLSKGWRHYSSLYGGSPEPEKHEAIAIPSSNSPTKRHRRSLSKGTTEALNGGANDKFTSLPRRERVVVNEKQSCHNRLGHSSSDTSLVNIDLSDQTAPAFRSVRLDEQRQIPSYSSDEGETDGGTAPFSSTPRSANGGVRHKSIRRVLAERMNDRSQTHTIGCSMSNDSNPFSDSVHSPGQLSADQMSLNDLPPTPMPLRVISKRQDRPRPQSVSDVVREYDERVRERREAGSEIEEDIGLSEVEALVEPAKGPARQMNSKYRRTQQWLKDAPGSDDDIALARAAFLSRATTLASTIPSVYSPDTDHPSPTIEDIRTTDRSPVNGLGLEYDDASDALSAAQMAKAARGRHRRDEMAKDASTKESFPPVERPKSPLPELPSEIMSPPLEADLFFSDRPTPSSPPERSSHPATATKAPGGGHDSVRLKLKANRKLHSPRSSPLKGASPTAARLVAASAPTSNRLMGPHRTLARNATTATVITNRSITPPPSHFTSKARAEANSKVDMIVQRSWEAKEERPTSPTGFGARSESDVEPPAVLWRQSGGGKTFGYSPVPDGVEGDGYVGGIEQRLALLKDNGIR